LVDFLHGHGAKFRRLSLSWITLTEGDRSSLLTRIAGHFPRLREINVSGDFCTIFPLDPLSATPEFSIDTPEVRQFSELLGDAIEDDIRAGGDLPDLDALQQQQIALEEIGEVPDDYVHNDEEDGGYDSDGSSISYGSDDFNKEI